MNTDGNIHGLDVLFCVLIFSSPRDNLYHINDFMSKWSGDRAFLVELNYNYLMFCTKISCVVDILFISRLLDRD
jgi:hypothetical protein